MSKKLVSIVKYEKPLESVRKAVDLCKGLDHLPSKAIVFIKPNIVFSTKAVAFPKWGVITTSRVIEDVVMLLRERGIDDITIGEGMVLSRVKDKETPAHAFETLGYNTLKKRFGVKAMNVFEGELEKVDLGDGIELTFSSQIIHSDFVVDIPAIKTNNCLVVSFHGRNIHNKIAVYYL